MKKLYEFYWDCGRMGSLTGIFTAEEESLQELIGKYMYFGEVLGKHSEIDGNLSAQDFTVKSEDQDFINKLIEVFGEGTISGTNPFDYYDPEEDEEEQWD